MKREGSSAVTEKTDPGVAYWSELAVTAVDDDAAFTELYQHFFPRVYNFLLGRTKDAAVADEIVSRAFYKMYQFLGTYDSKKGAFSTWLFSIARNELLMYQRSTRSNTAELNEESMTVPNFELPETKYLKKELETALKAELQKLSEHERRMVVMTYWYDMSAVEVAEACGMKPGAVRTALSRVRAALRKSLEAQL